MPYNISFLYNDIKNRFVKNPESGNKNIKYYRVVLGDPFFTTYYINNITLDKL